MNLDNERLRQFIENSADLMEEHGFPRMAGRVIGALMICTPPHLSHEELAEQLQASKGSISMSTQLLLRMNVVERVSLPGQRCHFYRLRENLWKGFLSEVASHINREREVTMDGLAVLEGEPVEMKRRLIEMLVVSDFVLEEWPGLVSRWEARRDELLKKRLTEMAQDAEARK
ncbi:MAG: MarR family transcriptional regulator [Candidatus Bipolaricaulota bacterium]|nr:MarR family transcriptional regulator [Candidatus Bipolaricaulota bacterium]